jgi:predicted TIM-barrel fold metal-dependent hydrolase
MDHVSRRTAIRALATGGVVAGLAARSTAASAAPTGNYRIDLHSHFLPPRYRDALTATGYTVKSLAPVPSWSPEEALAFMDGHAIAAQVVSISDPGVGFLSGAAAVEMVRYTNDYAADLVARYPTRFGAFASLPLPDVGASLAELTYALDVRRLDGVVLLSSYDGIYLGDARFEPIMAALNARGAFVFVHPAEVPADNKPELPFPAFYVEYPFDTTRAATVLMASGTIDRYPNIRFSLAHAGGCVPFLATRLQLPRSAVPAAPDVSVFAAEKSIAKFFYDTSLSASAAAMRSVLEVTDIDNVVFGSDWPFSGLVYRAGTTTDPAPGLSEVFDNDQRYRIERLNALQQLPSLAQRITR